MRQVWIFRAIASSMAAAYLAGRIVAVPPHYFAFLAARKEEDG
jgi:hypothetical protein